MIYTVDELRQLVAPIAEKHALPAVYLFGSYARGEATEQSDVDLLVDTSGTEINGLFALGGLYSELEDALKKPLDLVTLGSLYDEPLKKSTAMFRDVIMNERLSIYDAQR